MGRREKESKPKKKGGIFRFLLKTLFSLAFLALTVIVTLFTVSYIGIKTSGGGHAALETSWKWAAKIPYVVDLYDMIQNKGSKGVASNIGAMMFLVGLDVLFIYLTIMFPIKRIPIIGSIIKWLTGIIPSLSVIVAVVGGVLLFAI